MEVYRNHLVSVNLTTTKTTTNNQKQFSDNGCKTHDYKLSDEIIKF